MGCWHQSVAVHQRIHIIIEFNRIPWRDSLLSATAYPFSALAYLLDRSTKRAVSSQETCGQMDPADPGGRGLEERSAHKCEGGWPLISASATVIAAGFSIPQEATLRKPYFPLLPADY